jgi:hypothetical protein
MSVDYILILQREYADREWSISDDDFNSMTFYDDGPVPTQDELNALWPAVRDAEAWDNIRAERDSLLAASDWTQMPDSPLNGEQKNAWADYRQELRDLPQSFATPDEVVWPEAP